MDLAFNDLQRLICHKTKPTNHQTPTELSALQTLDSSLLLVHMTLAWPYFWYLGSVNYYIITCTYWVASKKMVCVCMYIWEEAHERKKNRYETLCADCVEKGWICYVIPIEVDCWGFLEHSVISFLSKIGITGRSLKVALNRLQTMALYASSWIWLKAKIFSMNEMHAELPVPCDYVTSRKGYCKCKMTSTVKRVFKNHKLH